jgi:hypothetical protein
MTCIPTESLKNVFIDLDFLSGIMENQKYCFKNRYYVDKKSIFGSIVRMIDSECLDISGITKIGSICKNAVELFETIQIPTFKNILQEKIISARKGLERTAITYETLNKNVTASNIRNQGILLLDGVLSNEIKLKEGFILYPN